MFDGDVLCVLIVEERLVLIVPEIEVIYIETLVQLECEFVGRGIHIWIVPIVRVARLTMDREGICWFVVEMLGLLMLVYCFVDMFDDYCVVVICVVVVVCDCYLVDGYELFVVLGSNGYVSLVVVVGVD